MCCVWTDGEEGKMNNTHQMQTVHLLHARLFEGYQRYRLSEGVVGGEINEVMYEEVNGVSVEMESECDVGEMEKTVR